MSTKKKFIVEENETIDMCLERMKAEGYMPFKRTEKPIFKEIIENGKTVHEPAGRKIVFEGKKSS